MVSPHRLLSLALALIFVTTLKAEKPFDFDSTPGKLPKDVVPQDYALRIVPDVKKLIFTGSESITIKVRQPVRRLVLNSADIKITRATLNEKAIPASALKLDPKEETLTITLADQLAAGDHHLSLDFTGKINQQGQGLFYVPYQTQELAPESEEAQEKEREREEKREKDRGKAEKKTEKEREQEREKEKEAEEEPPKLVFVKKIMLGTQFEATDARRLFPCWDEPSFRARFQLTVIVPENFYAYSNMPVEKETKFAGGKEIRFQKTPPMATYLNVLCTGELESLTAKMAGVDHGVVTTSGKIVWGRYALDSSQQILGFYNDYFGTPYPLPKIDHIAIPGGFGGAMENWGGITYYESVLLYDPGNSSSGTKQGVYEVIAHEMAHMWFGDLVTMAWWDNLWLNEGFASWMGSKCTAKFNPDWEVWLERHVPRDPTRRDGIGKETAMESDARSTTHPIQQPIANEVEANSAFDEITYTKGMSFIGMLESFLGEEVFRDGIRKYIAAHKLSNATTADLWNALSEASGKPVGEIAAAWTEQPGFPIIKVKRDPSGKITLTQERFTVHFDNPPPLEWKIPLTYSIAGEAKPNSLLMNSKSIDLPSVPAERAVKLNVNGQGNYRVQYDEPSWKLLLAELPKLSPTDRVNLLADAWALAQANRAPFSLYLDLVEKLPPQLDLAEREQIMSVFDYINRLFVDEPHRDQFQAYARSVLRPSFDQLGWGPKKGEPFKSALLRASLIKALGDLNDPEIIAGCRDRFKKALTDPTSVPPDLRAPIASVVGRYADLATWNKLRELGRETTSIEEKQYYYDALASATDPKLIQRSLEISLTDEVPTSRAVSLVAKVARESDHPDLAWQFAKTHMKQLRAKVDSLTANSYGLSLFNFFSNNARISELEKYAKDNLPPAAAKSVAKSVDEVGFRAEFKPRLAKQIAEWPGVPAKSSK